MIWDWILLIKVMCTDSRYGLRWHSRTGAMTGSPMDKPLEKVCQKKDPWGWSLHFLGQPVPEHPYQDTDSCPSDCTWLWDREGPNHRFNSYKMGKINRKNLRAQGKLKETKGSSSQTNSANLLRRQSTDLQVFFSRNLHLYRDFFPSTLITSQFTAWSWWLLREIKPESPAGCDHAGLGGVWKVPFPLPAKDRNPRGTSHL